MKSIFVAVTFICLAMANVASASDIVLWQQELTFDATSLCKPVAMAVDNKNDELIILSADTRDTDLQLWKMHPNGTVKTNKSLDLLSEHSLGIKVAVMPDTGDIVRLINDADSISLSVINRNMQASVVELNTPTPKISGALIFLDIISYPNGSLLLVGKDEDSGIVMKTDLAGNIVWEKPFDTGKTVILNSLASNPENSSFYVAGKSGSVSSEIWGFTEVKTCLLRYDKNGELEASVFFEGSPAPWASSLPKVICLRSGIVLVVYDKSKNGKATELYARAYTKELTPLWEKPILQTEENGVPAVFDICATAEDRFVFAGIANHQDLRIYEYRANGTILQTLELDEETNPGDVYVDYLDEKILVAYPARRQENEEKSKIKVMALKPYKTS